MSDKTLSDREMILQEFRRQGKRITGQRKVILDIVLRQKWESCKDVYFEAVKIDPTIGLATVYRMIDALEAVGVLQKRCSYSVNRDWFEQYSSTES